jgi:hypothetical protein
MAPAAATADPPRSARAPTRGRAAPEHWCGKHRPSTRPRWWRSKPRTSPVAARASRSALVLARSSARAALQPSPGRGSSPTARQTYLPSPVHSRRPSRVAAAWLPSTAEGRKQRRQTLGGRSSERWPNPAALALRRTPGAHSTHTQAKRCWSCTTQGAAALAPRHAAHNRAGPCSSRAVLVTRCAGNALCWIALFASFPPPGVSPPKSCTPQRPATGRVSRRCQPQPCVVAHIQRRNGQAKATCRRQQQ